MADLVAKFDKLTINANDNERDLLYGYLFKVRTSRNFFPCANNFYVYPDQSCSKYVLCERKLLSTDTLVLCHACKNCLAFENLRKLTDISKIKSEYCIHAQLCELLFTNTSSDKQKVYDKKHKHYVEVLDSHKVKISVVHPSEDSNKLPGVVVLTSRTTKPKCHTCKGFKCLHVNIYLENKSDKFRDNTEKNVDAPLETEKQPIQRDKYKNPLDPTDKSGTISNIFNVRINFPPNEEEKRKISQINKVSNIFDSNILHPNVGEGEQCDCGHLYNAELDLGNVESSKIYIHHSKVTTDSRNSSFIVLFASTGLCDHKLFYTGEQHKLL